VVEGKALGEEVPGTDVRSEGNFSCARGILWLEKGTASKLRIIQGIGPGEKGVPPSLVCREFREGGGGGGGGGGGNGYYENLRTPRATERGVSFGNGEGKLVRKRGH